MFNELNASANFIQCYLIWIINLSPGWVATFTLFMFFVFFVTFEFYSPREKLRIKQVRQSYRTNIGLFFLNSVLTTLLCVPSLLFLAEEYSDNGVLKSIANPLSKGILSFLAIDLSLYLLHKASHAFDCLWMFHKVHHNDPYLNVSTAFRIHFLEILIINTIRAILIVVLGIEGTLLLINESVIIFCTMMHHTNISFRGEQYLGRVFITPYLHRVHHSTIRDEHDRNYGAVLSIWDRLFGTLAELNPAGIGLKGNSPQALLNLVKYGFTLTDKSSVQPVSLDAMIAEAAYYKAEKRGFYPGNELRDWLEAKREIIRMVYGNGRQKNNLMQNHT